MNNLSECPLGAQFQVVELRGSVEIVQRLQDLGVAAGATVSVIGQAPFCGPLLILVRAAVVAMRRNEAECVVVNPVLS